MAVTKDVAKRAIGLRVEVDHGVKDVGTLAAVTPAGWLILTDSRGRETLIELSSVKTMNDARYLCDRCGDRVNKIYSGRCATCEREWAKKQPVPREQCEEHADCLGKAYYSPKAKAFLCPQHHAQRGTNVGLHVESRVREAVCRGADVTDERHEWKKLKSRYCCRHCFVSTFEVPAAY